MRGSSPKARRAARVAGLLAFGALSLAAAGCRTFNYTEADLERERKLLAESSAFAGYGVGLGGFQSGIGKIGCGNMHLGGVGCRHAGK